MKRFLETLCFLICSLPAFSQNWATVSATNITDLNQSKLAAGQLCFLGTDQNDNPISFSVGGGGQVLKRAFCSAVANGAVTAFTVPNPANASPSGIYYRVTVKDTSTGLEVLRYTQVTFSGGAFSFDNYAPANLGNFAPLSGNAVSGNLSVSGNASITGSLTAGSFSPTVLISGQFTSNTVNPAGAGILRLASGDAIGWRNNANAATLALAKTGAAAGGVPADTLDMSAFGGLKLASPAISAETAAPPGVAGSDVLYADSTAHRWKMINNNGAADIVTGAASSDTLSNKTLTGPSNGNSVTLLNEQGPTGTFTGNNADQVIYTYTLKANTLGPGKCLEIETYFNHPSGSASVAWKVFWGASNFANNSSTLIGTLFYKEILCNNAGVTNAQHGSAAQNVNNTVSVGGNGTFNVFSPLTGSVDTTADQTITLSCNVANTDTCKGDQFLVKLIQ